MSLTKKFLGLELYIWLLMAILLGFAVFLIWYGNVAGILGVDPWA